MSPDGQCRCDCTRRVRGHDRITDVGHVDLHNIGTQLLPDAWDLLDRFRYFLTTCCYLVRCLYRFAYSRNSRILNSRQGNSLVW